MSIDYQNVIKEYELVSIKEIVKSLLDFLYFDACELYVEFTENIRKMILKKCIVSFRLTSVIIVKSHTFFKIINISIN